MADPEETFRRLLTANGTLHENTVDGNSFYKSIADFLQDGRDYVAIREVIYGHMRDNVDAYDHALDGDTREEKLANLAQLFRDGVEPREEHIHFVSMIFDLRIVIFFPPNGRAVYNESEAFQRSVYLSFHQHSHFNRLSDMPDLPAEAADLADGAFELEESSNATDDAPRTSGNDGVGSRDLRNVERGERHDIVDPPAPAELMIPIMPELPLLNETEAEFRRILYTHCHVFHNRRDGNSFYASLAAILPGGGDPIELKELIVDYVRNNTHNFPSLFQEGDSEAEKRALVEQMSGEGIDAMEFHIAAAAIIFNIRIVVYHSPNSRKIETLDGFDGTLYLARDRDYHYDRIVRGPELPDDAGDLDDNAFDTFGVD